MLLAREDPPEVPSLFSKEERCPVNMLNPALASGGALRGHGLSSFAVMMQI